MNRDRQFQPNCPNFPYPTPYMPPVPGYPTMPGQVMPGVPSMPGSPVIPGATAQTDLTVLEAQVQRLQQQVDNLDRRVTRLEATLNQPTPYNNTSNFQMM